jgi:Domain of unknown function (DUF5615)
VRVLLDESVPRQLATELPSHDVRTVVQVGWTGVQNGELLRRAAEAGYEVLVTMDRNLEHQQNIARAGVGVLVITARDSRVETVLPLAGSINSALSGLHPGMVVHVGA